MRMQNVLYDILWLVFIILLYDRITLFESPMVSLCLLSSWNISNTVLFLRPEAMSLPSRTELSPDFTMHTSTNSSLLHFVALSSHAALASPILCCRLAISASVACLRWGKCLSVTCYLAQHLIKRHGKENLRWELPVAHILDLCFKVDEAVPHLYYLSWDMHCAVPLAQSLKVLFPSRKPLAQPLSAVPLLNWPGNAGGDSTHGSKRFKKHKRLQ